MEEAKISTNESRVNSLSILTRYEQLLMQRGRFSPLQGNRVSLQERFLHILEHLDENEEIDLLRQLAGCYNFKFLGQRKEDQDTLFELAKNVKIEELKKSGMQRVRETLTIPLQDGGVVTCNPFIKLLSTNIFVTTRKNLLNLLNIIDEMESRWQSSVRLVGINLSDDSADFSEIVNRIIETGFFKNASDVHIEYDSLQKVSIVKYRIHGELIRYFEFPGEETHERLCNRIFILAGLNPSDYMKIHDCKIQHQVGGKLINLRVSSVPVRNADGTRRVPSIVMRYLFSVSEQDFSNSFLNLGFSQDLQVLFEEYSKLPYGMVLLCGPTGSGKTTTLYSFLMMRTGKSKILTIEDPVEIIVSDVTQVEYQEENNINFSTAVRAFLRQDPDIILIGEIRDQETAHEATRAAMTGHLVLSTLHANTAMGVIVRLLDLGVKPRILGEVLKLVLSQRLVKKLCPECRVPVNVNDPDQIRQYFKIDLDEFKSRYPYFYQEYGYGSFRSRNCSEYIYLPGNRDCAFCGGTGHIGRTVIWELIPITQNLAAKISNDEVLTDQDVFTRPEFTFIGSSLLKIWEGEISLPEAEKFVILNKKIG